MIAPPPARGSAAASSWALAVLFVTNVFNQGDRMLFGVVAEPIRKDIGLTDTQLALASGLFFVLFSLLGGIFIARLIDRGNRVRILAAGIAVWSLATAATGFAHDYLTMSVARILVGIGEATAFPVAMSLIPDLFSVRVRGRAVSIYQSSNFVGIVGGTILAGVLAASMGWRSMFIVCGLAGVIVATVMVLTVTEPCREASGDGQPADAYWADLASGFRRVLGNRDVVVLSLGLGFATMMGAVLGAWGPAFLIRVHGVALGQVGLLIGPPVGLGGIIGTVASGFMADMLIRRSGRPERMLVLSLFCVLLALPFMAGFVFAADLRLALVSAGAMNFFLSAAIPPITNYTINHVGPRDRGVAATVLLIAMGLVGGALGPAIVGAISDGAQSSLGPGALRNGLAFMLLSPVAAGALVLVALRGQHHNHTISD